MRIAEEIILGLQIFFILFTINFVLKVLVPEDKRGIMPKSSDDSPDKPQGISKTSAPKDEKGAAVSVPEAMAPLFQRAGESVKDYFSDKVATPSQGIIEIKGERYILVRAASMSKEFFQLVQHLYQDRGKDEARRTASGFLFDFAHALGKADARGFHARMKLTDPMEKLSVGPIHFAYTGWAFVKLLPESSPTADENFYLIYDHLSSFESDAWAKAGKHADFPVCIMNSGYSCGWCEESFGLPLVSVEVECRARGDAQCRFIMAPPSRIEAHVSSYLSRAGSPPTHHEPVPLDIPEFFQRKRMEDELRKSEKTARALLNATMEAAILLDVDGTILSINEMAAQRFESTPLQLEGKNAFHLLPDDLARRRKSHHQKVLETGEGLWYFDKRGDRWLETHLYPIKNPEGKIIRVAVYSKDITVSKNNEEELKQHRDHLEELVKERTVDLEGLNWVLKKEIQVREKAEEELKNEKERLDVTLKSIAEGVIVTGTDGTVTLLNRIAESLTATSQQEALGRNVDEILPLSREKGKKREPISLCEIIREHLEDDLSGDFVLRSGGRDERLVSISMAPVKVEEENIFGFVLAVRDITEAKKMEEELIRQRKIESVGVLAGGIAHDFNNLLTGILGNISLIKPGLDPDEKAYRQLESCEKAALRAKGLTHQLLTFSRGGAPIKESVKLDPLVRESVEFVLSGSRSTSTFDFPPDTWDVDVDQGQFSQVLNNLVINALQAMPEGGNIAVKLENIVNNGKKVPLEAERLVKLSIADEGRGISEADISRVFDPYFTTRDTGNGLGLATVYSIIKRHQGYIGVESTPGKGTVFYIYIPASEEPAEVEKLEPETAPLDRKLQVLLMDDDELIRTIAVEIFKRLGFDSETVDDGAEAVEAYRRGMEAGRPYDLVILDLTVPGGMGGKEALEELRLLDPNVTAMVSSGYSNDPVMANYKDYGFKGIMVKPYRVKEVKAALDSVLETQLPPL